MSLSPDEVAEIVEASDKVIFTLRLFTAAIALFSFDYSLTFTREVERIWKRGFSTPAVLFYLVRYPALMSVLFVILEETSWAGISDRSCSILVRVEMTLNVVLLGAASVFSALRVCALCWKDRRIFFFVLLLASVHPAIAAYTFAKSDISYITLPVPGCGFATAIPNEIYENWIIGARSSAVLTDMIVLGITIWKARPVRVQDVKIGVKSTMASILMRDGVLYFGVLLIANLIGLVLVRFFTLIQPMSTWIAILTAIMTSRFILDLHEAADPRFDQSNAATVSGASTLMFPTTSKHAPRFNSDLSFGIDTEATDYYDTVDDGDGRSTGPGVAECNKSERQWEIEPCLEAHADREPLSVMASRCDDVESVIWIR